MSGTEQRGVCAGGKKPTARSINRILKLFESFKIRTAGRKYFFDTLKAGDESLLPSAVFLSGQRCAQLAAGWQSVIVRSLVADHALTGQIGAVVVAAGLPAAHPFAVAPAVGAKQSDVLPAQPALTGGEHRLELALLQLLRPHGGAAKGDGGILADLLRRELCGGNHRHLSAFALGAFGYRHGP